MIYFDGSLTKIAGGARLVIIDPIKRVSILSFKLDLFCTDNEAKYEPAIIGLLTAKKPRVKKVKLIGDSNMVI